LENEEVRKGLKEYSKWPTYPQLYANGQLLGGLDVVRRAAVPTRITNACLNRWNASRELAEAGELSTLLS